MEELYLDILLYHPSELYSFYFRITPQPFSSEAERHVQHAECFQHANALYDEGEDLQVATPILNTNEIQF